MCICNVYLFNNKDKMTKFLSSPTLAYISAILFKIFCNLESICLYNREIILAALLRQNSKTNMTKNRDKIMKCIKENHEFLPYCQPLD